MAESDNLPCSDKLTFDSEKAARAHTTVIKFQRGTKLRAYKCRHCQLWHLSSNPGD